VDDGGYSQSGLWLSDAWSRLQDEGIGAPLYWARDADGALGQYTLGGFRPLDPAEPVCHISYYEADAFARWSGRRLPTEAEWEVAFAGQSVSDGDYLDLSRLHPRALDGESGLPYAFGGVWEWTASPYSAYPGYAPALGAIGEYNGKFMSNQMVLRGGSCATPRGHVRPTYRNFFAPGARWQFTGLRLCI
jgi:ergothioneine biosynthesis protein EgtB